MSSLHTYIPYASGIGLIDSHYLRPGLAAIYLLVENGRAALIETGCNSSLPFVLAALAQQNIPSENVDYVIPTHVHLDHAGGAGGMMRVFPNARLAVHPRGARHLIDPSRLIEGTIAVYGAEATQRLYGEILPVDADRIIEATDGLVLSLAGRHLLCVDTPGHAKHHIAVIDEKTGHIFTGDTFGMTYAQLSGEVRQFVFPTTTPVQFDPPALQASMKRLLAYRPAAMYVTHFGQLRDVDKNGEVLHQHIDAFVDIARQSSGQGESRHVEIRAALGRVALAEARAVGCRLPDAEILALLTNDLELNAQGLAVWLDAQSSPAS